MIPKRTDLASRAAAIAGREHIPTQTPVRQGSEALPVTATADAPPRVKPVRMVVEMQPVEHRNLRRLADRYADELAVPQVAMSEIVRVLCELARCDEQVAQKVGTELKRTGGTRRR